METPTDTPNKLQEVIEDLNQLLIGYQVHYQNLRLFHWNVKGPFFFILHDKFEELYRDAAEKIDEIAERILALEGTPKGALSSILKYAVIDSSEELIEPKAMVGAVLKANKVLIADLGRVLRSAGDAGDEGTLDIFTGYIRELEKQNWMLRSFLE